LNEWAKTFGTTHTLLGDADLTLFNQYQEGDTKPQYVVFDREMNIVYRGHSQIGHGQSKAAVLALLAE
jgi:hypothetical protein